MVLADHYRNNGYQFWDQKISTLFLIMVPGIGLMGLIAVYGGTVGRTLNDIPAATGYTALVALTYAVTKKTKHLVKLFTFIGFISYELYLTHVFVAMLFNKILFRHIFHNLPYIKILFFSFLAIITAVAFNKIISEDHSNFFSKMDPNIRFFRKEAKLKGIYMDLTKSNVKIFNRGRHFENPRFWSRFSVKPNFQGATVLEIGSGWGSLCVDIALAGASKVVGLDLKSDLINFATQHIEQNFPQLVNIIEFKDIDLKFYGNTAFDYIVSKDSFEHIIDVPGMLKEMKKRLKPGGKIFIGFGPIIYQPIRGP